MNHVVDILSWSCLLAGATFLLIGVIGLLRFPDFFTRLHAASVIETLGSLLIVTGLALQTEQTLVIVKLVLLIVFIMFTSPTAAHALAKAALHGKLEPVTSTEDNN
ncbi:MAG: monovalent cation/H(+) antiporter subunit G [Gammaproteobacteria bacterium]